MHADQMIPVADGISLAADICTPKRDARQVPPYYSRNTIHFGEDSCIELTRL